MMPRSIAIRKGPVAVRNGAKARRGDVNSPCCCGDPPEPWPIPDVTYCVLTITYAAKFDCVTNQGYAYSYTVAGQYQQMLGSALSVFMQQQSLDTPHHVSGVEDLVCGKALVTYEVTKVMGVVDANGNCPAMPSDAELYNYVQQAFHQNNMALPYYGKELSGNPDECFEHEWLGTYFGGEARQNIGLPNEFMYLEVMGSMPGRWVRTAGGVGYCNAEPSLGFNGYCSHSIEWLVRVRQYPNANSGDYSVYTESLVIATADTVTGNLYAGPDVAGSNPWTYGNYSYNRTGTAEELCTPPAGKKCYITSYADRVEVYPDNWVWIPDTSDVVCSETAPGTLDTWECVATNRARVIREGNACNTVGDCYGAAEAPDGSFLCP